MGAPKKEVYKLHKNGDYHVKKAKKTTRGRGSKSSALTVFVNLNKEPIGRKLVSEFLDEAASQVVREKFCDVSGFEAKNTHNKNYLHYSDSFVFKYIKQMPQNVKDEFRSLRGIKKGF